MSVENHLDGWKIGLPLLDPSICGTGRGNLNDRHQNKQVSREAQEPVVEPVHECWIKLEQDSTLDPSYGTTLPLQVKVT